MRGTRGRSGARGIRAVFAAAVAAAACRASPGATAADVERDVLAYLTATERSETIALRRSLDAARQELGAPEYRRAVEKVAATPGLDERAKVAYLGLAQKLGASSLFRDTAICMLRDGSADAVGNIAVPVHNYMRRNARPGSPDRGAFVKAIWDRLERGDAPRGMLLLGILAEDEPERVDRFVLSALKAKGRPENEKAGLLSQLCASRTLSKEQIARALEDEMRSSQTAAYRKQLGDFIARVAGQERADKAFDSAPPLRPSSDKVDPKYRGLSQAELLKQEVTAAFVDTPPLVIVDFLRATLGLDIRVKAADERALAQGARSTISTRGRSAKQVLALVLLPVDLAPKVVGGHVEIVKGSLPDTTTAAQKKSIREKMARPVSIECRGKPLAEGLGLLGTLMRVPIVISPRAERKAQKKVNVVRKSSPAQDVLRSMLLQAGLKWRFLHGAVYVE